MINLAILCVEIFGSMWLITHNMFEQINLAHQLAEENEKPCHDSIWEWALDIPESLYHSSSFCRPITTDTEQLPSKELPPLICAIIHSQFQDPEGVLRFLQTQEGRPITCDFPS